MYQTNNIVSEDNSLFSRNLIFFQLVNEVKIGLYVIYKNIQDLEVRKPLQ